MNSLQKIQTWMKDHSIDVFIINRTDEFLGEYIASYAERLKWISNFSGSSGKAIIFKEQANLYVDGRYTIQAHAQTDSKFFFCETYGILLEFFRGFVLRWKNYSHRFKFAFC